MTDMTFHTCLVTPLINTYMLWWQVVLM